MMVEIGKAGVIEKYDLNNTQGREKEQKAIDNHCGVNEIVYIAFTPLLSDYTTQPYFQSFF